MTKTFPSISLIIPAYNEETRIAPVLDRYHRFLSENFSQFELIVVPNNCSDQTAAISRSFAEKNRNVRVMELNYFSGKGGAVQEGFKSASMDWVGFVDADDSTAPKEFQKLCDCLSQNSSLSGAIGSRGLKESNLLKQQPFHRVFLGKGLNVLVSMLFGLHYSDTQCGAKLFRKKALQSVLPSLRVKGWEFDVELLWRLKQRNYAVLEVPIAWLNDEQTKLQLSAVVGMGLGLIRLRFQNDSTQPWMVKL